MPPVGRFLYSGVGRDIAAAGAGVGDALREIGSMQYKSAHDAQDYADRVAYRNYLERRDIDKADATRMQSFARDLRDTHTSQGVGDLLRAYGPTMSGYMPAVPPTAVQAPSIPGFDTSAPASVLSTPGRPEVNPLSPLAGSRLAELAANPQKQGGLTYRGMRFNSPQEYFDFINREARAKHLPPSSTARPHLPSSADVRGVLDPIARQIDHDTGAPTLVMSPGDYSRIAAGALAGKIPLTAVPDSGAAAVARYTPDVPAPSGSDSGPGLLGRAWGLGKQAVGGAVDWIEHGAGAGGGRLSGPAPAVVSPDTVPANATPADTASADPLDVARQLVQEGKDVGLADSDLIDALMKDMGISEDEAKKIVQGG